MHLCTILGILHEFPCSSLMTLRYHYLYFMYRTYASGIIICKYKNANYNNGSCIYSFTHPAPIFHLLVLLLTHSFVLLISRSLPLFSFLFPILACDGLWEHTDKLWHGPKNMITDHTLGNYTSVGFPGRGNGIMVIEGQCPCSWKKHIWVSRAEVSRCLQIIQRTIICIYTESVRWSKWGDEMSQDVDLGYLAP